MAGVIVFLAIIFLFTLIICGALFRLASQQKELIAKVDALSGGKGPLISSGAGLAAIGESAVSSAEAAPESSTTSSLQDMVVQAQEQRGVEPPASTASVHLSTVPCPGCDFVHFIDTSSPQQKYECPKCRQRVEFR